MDRSAGGGGGPDPVASLRRLVPGLRRSSSLAGGDIELVL